MDGQTAHCVLFSTDPEFRDVVKSALSRMQAGITMGLEITVPFAAVTDDHLNELREVNPDLVYHNVKGQPESVRYEAVNALLLNEFLKEHKKVEAQQASIAQLKSTVALQQK